MITAMGDVLREAYKRGWITTRDGNVSVRRGKLFYISPSGWRKTLIHPEHVLKYKIDVNGVPVATEESTSKPSGELEMHWKLQTCHFGGKPRSVLHIHPTYIIAAMHAGWDLRTVANQFPEVSRYTKVGKNVPTLPVTSSVLAEETFWAMTDGHKIRFDIVGQESHGVCAVGQSPWDAFEHVERLEHICQIVLASGVKPDAKD